MEGAAQPRSSKIDLAEAKPPQAAALPSVSPLTFGQKLTYGVGSTSLGVAGIGLSTGLVTFFMNQVVGVPAIWVGAALMAGVAIDALFDPLLGQWSDGVRTRLGRRHPFMFASAPLALIAGFLFWRPPAGLGVSATFAYMMALLVMLRLAVSLYEIPSSALAPELTPDYHERTTLFGYRWFFIIVGGLAMNAVLYLWFLRPANGGLLNAAGYAQWGTLAAVVIAVSILICCVGTLSRIPALPRLPSQTVSLRETIRQVASTVTNPSLVAVMVAGLIGGVTNGLNLTLSNYFYIYLWEMKNTQISAITFFAGLSSIVAVGLAPGVSKRFGKKRSMLTLFGLSIFIGAIPLTLKLLGLAPPNGSLATSVLLCADLFFAATLGVMGYIIISSMIADVVEDVAVRTGKRSEGLLFAANGLLPKLSAGVGAFLGGVLIAVVGISARAGGGAAPRPEVMLHLALAYLPFSLVLGVCSLIALGFYKIDQTTHEGNLERLQQTVEA